MAVLDKDGLSYFWEKIKSTFSTKTELNGKANSNHNHTIANVTNLQSFLDGKANTSHTHSSANITDLKQTIIKVAYVPNVATASVNNGTEYSGVNIRCPNLDYGYTTVTFINTWSNYAGSSDCYIYNYCLLPTSGTYSVNGVTYSAGARIGNFNQSMNDYYYKSSSKDFLILRLT